MLYSSCLSGYIASKYVLFLTMLLSAYCVLCLFNFCFLYVGVLWIFSWNVNSSKLFTDIDQFYNFIHFPFFTSIFRLYQNTGPKTVQTNNNWYLQKGKKFQMISKVYFVRKLNVKTFNYAAILIFFSCKI